MARLLWLWFFACLAADACVRPSSDKVGIVVKSKIPDPKSNACSRDSVYFSLKPAAEIYAEVYHNIPPKFVINMSQ